MASLSRAQVLRDCDRRDFQRGESYFRRQRVLHCEAQFTDNELRLDSLVQGTRRYQQTIQVSDLGAGTIRGRCSCPVGYNCKHVVAACLQHIAGGQAVRVNDNDAPLMRWLQDLETLASPQDRVGAEKERTPRVVYLLTPQPARDSSRQRALHLELRTAKQRADGNGWTKGQKLSPYGLEYDWRFREAALPIDKTIIALLSGGGDGATTVLSGPAGAIALEQMQVTGRVFLRDTARPLNRGGTRPAELIWQEDRNALFQLSTRIQPEAAVVNTEPPWYLDEQQGEIGPLDIGEIAPALWPELLKAPNLTRELARKLSLHLNRSTIALPVPEPIPLQRTRVSGEAPVPALQLLGVNVNHDGQQGVTYALELAYRYAGILLQPVPEQQQSRAVLKDAIYEIHRALEAEQQALAQLERAGFERLQSQAPGSYAFVPDSREFNSALSIWESFLADTLPSLRDQGWEIIEDESFDLSFHHAELDTDIESDNDWFALRFDLDVDGEKLPLAPLIAPWINTLLARPDEDWPETLNLPLGDGRIIRLNAARLRPTLKVLGELFDPDELAGNDLRRSRIEAAPLARLDATRLQAGGRALIELARKLNDFSGIATAPLPRGLKAQLRDYQQQGLNWLQFLREYGFGGILADDMGLGKTLQTLAHLLLEKQQGRLKQPALVIAPTSLMANWRDEARRFTPDLKVLVLQGADRHQYLDQLDQADVVLSTYPLLSRDAATLKQRSFSWLVLDEAQNIKNPKTKAARLIRELNVEHRLCLTGTPMENHLGELWAQFDFLMPGFLWDATSFRQRYRTPIEKNADLDARAALSRRIAPFMLRRTKTQVATELPKKTEILLRASFPAPQAQLYESIRIAMDKRVREAIAKQGLARSHITILDALLKLRQTCCDPRLLKLAQAGKVRDSAKLAMLMDLLPEQLEEGRKILLFSQFTQMLGLIENELKARDIDYSKLTGQTRKREEAIHRFRSGEVDLFLISLKAGGVGLNLPEADTVILYDPWWNPAVEAQAADRAHRIGQDKPVFVYKLLIENSVEETIVAMQAKKRALAEAIYSGKADAGDALFDPDSLKALFAPLA